MIHKWMNNIPLHLVVATLTMKLQPADSHGVVPQVLISVLPPCPMTFVVM